VAVGLLLTSANNDVTKPIVDTVILMKWINGPTFHFKVTRDCIKGKLWAFHIMRTLKVCIHINIAEDENDIEFFHVVKFA